MQWKQRFIETIARVRADRGRFSVLCVLGLIALLLWARIIVIARPPRTAVAEPVVVTAPVQAPASDNHGTASTISLASIPLRNPFAVSEADFPSASTNKSVAAAPPAAPRAVPAPVSPLVGLTLNAVMPNARLAMINGTVVRIGGQVPSAESLQLLEVRARSVILTTPRSRYELLMAVPTR